MRKLAFNNNNNIIMIIIIIPTTIFIVLSIRRQPYARVHFGSSGQQSVNRQR